MVDYIIVRDVSNTLLRIIITILMLESISIFMKVFSGIDPEKGGGKKTDISKEHKRMKNISPV